jgi:hypothetical protein
MNKVLITGLLVAVVGVGTATAQPPQTITYQGLLTDASGSPVADGNYSLTFRIYDAASGGTQLWSETQSSVVVSGGLFKARLGSVTPITVDFDTAYWLEIQVGAESPQIPRIELTSTPYTFMAMDIEDDAVTSAKILDGEVATADIEDDAVTAAKIAPNVVSSIDGVSNDGGDIDLVAGSNVTITPNDGANTITIAASGGGGGDITGVSAGQGLTGGGTSGDVYLDVGAGTGIAVSADAVGLTSAYADGSAHDSRFVNEGQSNSVTSAMIVDGTIQPGDMGFSAGDVTAVWSGDGLSGGGDQGDLTLSVDNPLELWGSSTGVIRGTHTSGNYGTLGDSQRGVLGQGASGNWGYCGGVSFNGAYGYHAGSGNSGALGSADYGVTGNNAGGNWGALGTGDEGVYGQESGGNYAYLGHYQRGAAGYNANGNYGTLGSVGYGVYYSGGLGGSGSKSCIVKTSQGPTALYCQESPESWFEDFGQGTLVKGRAHVELDPLFLETVTIDAGNPMRIFVELGGDCNGVYVAKGTSGFDVIELQGGSSSVPFDYRVVAKRRGFEGKRLAYCEEAESDPYLYPELKGEQSREFEERNSRMEEAARLAGESGETTASIAPQR